MKRTQAITTLQRRITDILGSAGLPTTVTSAIDQEFIQAINEIDEDAPAKPARAKKAKKAKKTKPAKPAKKAKKARR